MTVQGLQLFNPRATENNGIPTVNHNLHSADGVKVLMNAPNDALPSDYFDFTMNMIDKVRAFPWKVQSSRSNLPLRLV